jgi:SAM-dependent methyltransferase
MSDFNYIGSELELFAAVRNWKSYWSSSIQPFISGDTLEVGAGLGSNTPYLDQGGNHRWVCLEPDARLIAELTSNLQATRRDRPYEIVCGTLENIPADQKFATIIYIDVLEHIENDRAELEKASAHLRPGGRIIVLSPAHQWLFTPFDAAIGHFRRYNRAMLEGVSPASPMTIEKIWYMDSVGLALSLANRVLLKQSMPTKAQLHFWDHWVVPVSRVVDKCVVGSMGKSIVAVWRRKGEN